VNERDLRMRTHAAALGRFYLDALLGLTAIRAHQAAKAVRHQHEGLLVEWARSSLRVIRASLAIGAVQSVVCTGLPALMLVGHFRRAGGVTGADLLLVYWALKLPSLVGTLVGLAHQYPTQRTITLRLLEPLSAPTHVHSAEGSAAGPLPGAVDPPRATGRRSPSRGAAISLVEGTVVAGGHVILDRVSLEIAPGEHVAIVGPSGAGKSTLVGLLLGWHRLAHGWLRVDQESLSADVLVRLRERTAWVDPAVQIWNRTLLDNVGYSSRRLDGVRAAAALDAASLRDVVARLPQGLQTCLGEGGGLLSGGEGQRVRLARALAQPDVALALLDEPFRGLDRERRASLLAETRAHWSSSTLLCVTHDLSETKAFDRVLVVEGGRIVEDDEPGTLAARSSRYRALLDAEVRVRDRLWRSEAWRRVRVEAGAVHEDDLRPEPCPAVVRRW
ncbi:MAG: ATP-binding cassette domain-containing protein, partial [Vicinamibacterales bacterium]